MTTTGNTGFQSPLFGSLKSSMEPVTDPVSSGLRNCGVAAAALVGVVVLVVSVVMVGVVFVVVLVAVVVLVVMVVLVAMVGVLVVWGPTSSLAEMVEAGVLGSELGEVVVPMPELGESPSPATSWISLARMARSLARS